LKLPDIAVCFVQRDPSMLGNATGSKQKAKEDDSLLGVEPPSPSERPGSWRATGPFVLPS